MKRLVYVVDQNSCQTRYHEEWEDLVESLIDEHDEPRLIEPSAITGYLTRWLIVNAEGTVIGQAIQIEVVNSKAE